MNLLDTALRGVGRTITPLKSVRGKKLARDYRRPRNEDRPRKLTTLRVYLRVRGEEIESRKSHRDRRLNI